jgi:hypothetical protein
MTLHVTDSMGRNVPDAVVEVLFRIFEKPALKTGKTDENGIVSMEGRMDGEALYSVKKEGYYDTRATYWFRLDLGNDVVNGKWTPWNPTIDVTLKEKRYPIPMYAQSIEIILPKTNETFGFDFQIGDFVAPHGRGEVVDFLFTHEIKMSSEGNQECIERMTIEGMNTNDGVVLLKSDSQNKHPPLSRFPSIYEAPKDGYEQRLDMFTRWLQEKQIENTRIMDDEYLVFRSRTTTDNNGQIISAHYGKMYYVSFGRTRKNLDGGFVKMQYYFNPTSNDRNLEYDTNNNLFGNNWRNRILLPCLKREKDWLFFIMRFAIMTFGRNM